MKGSDFVFDYVQLLHYKCYKRNSNCDGSYVDFPHWTKTKKTTISPLNKKIINSFITL